MIAWTDLQFVVLGIGCLILAFAAYRGQRVGLKRTIIMGLIWGAIFLFVAMIFTAIGW